MGAYDDMIHLPRPVSASHPRLPMEKRAAQFAAFAALAGYEEATKETARLTQRRAELAEDEKAALDTKLRFLRDHLEEGPRAAFTFFRPDPRKAGGAYITATGQVKGFDLIRRTLSLGDKTEILLDDLTEIELLD